MKGSSGQKRRDEGPENIPKNNENLHKASRSLRGVEAAVGGEGIEEGMRTLIIRSCLWSKTWQPIERDPARDKWRPQTELSRLKVTPLMSHGLNPKYTAAYLEWFLGNCDELKPLFTVAEETEIAGSGSPVLSAQATGVPMMTFSPPPV